MPDFVWQFHRYTDVLPQDDRSMLSERKELRLRKLADDMLTFAEDGKYYEAVVDLPTKTIADATELYAFIVYADDQESDENVYLNVTVDGGTTWQWWDGAAWVDVVTPATDRNTIAEVDTNIGSLPKGEKQFSFRLFLVPSTDGSVSPVVDEVVLYAEFRMNFEEDQKRSLKRYLDSTLDCQRRALFDIAGADRITFASGEYPDGIKGPLHVFNLDDDPGRETDLFAAQDGYTIELASYVTGRIEVQYSFTPKVTIAMADEEITETTLPSIVLQFLGMERTPVELKGIYVYDIHVTAKEARKRLAPVNRKTNVRMVVQGDSEQDTLAMIDALEEAFDEEHRQIPSAGIGEPYAVVSLSEFSSSDIVIRSVNAQSASLRLSGDRWNRSYTAVPLTSEIILRMGTFGLGAVIEEVSLDA